MTENTIDLASMHIDFVGVFVHSLVIESIVGRYLSVGRDSVAGKLGVKRVVGIGSERLFD